MSDKNLMDMLKEAIRDRHVRMEELPFVAALMDGSLPFESYVAQLRALSVIHGTLDYELSKVTLPGVFQLVKSRPSRLIYLRRDLSALDEYSVPDCLEAIEKARITAGWIRRLALERPQDLLGIVYVLEGTTLGNAVHLPDLIKAFGDRVAGSTNYYSGYGERTEACWQEFRALMNSMPITLDDCNSILQATLEFFDHLETLYLALYPVNDDGWGFTAGMINPEAGQHPVPDTSTEIKAAVAAARRCREEFPYFDERFQERGRNFAKSDSAWLATLVELPLLQVLLQVEWLGRVLGNRGMPRITLERQLELLQEELLNAIPEGAERFWLLTEAAAHLRAQRIRRIPEIDFIGLAEAFRDATDGEMKGRFARTGELIVSSVCDEADGITDAVTSLCVWLCDSERFSQRWIAEVEKTVAQARSACSWQV